MGESGIFLPHHSHEQTHFAGDDGDDNDDDDGADYVPGSKGPEERSHDAELGWDL